MAMETIKVGDQTHEIEVKPVTIIVPAPDMAAGPPIQYPSRFRLSCNETTYHAERVKKLHADFPRYWNLFFANISRPMEVPPSCDPDEVRKMGNAAKHLMGLIDMTLKLRDQKVPVVWVYPESFMHPGWQVALGDLAITFGKEGQDAK